MNEKSNCPVCNARLKNFNREAKSNGAFIDCPVCGIFFYYDSVSYNEHIEKIKNSKAILSCWIRKHQSSTNKILLTSDLVSNILITTQLPKPKEQADSLLLWIGSTVNKIDEITTVPLQHLTSIIGAVDEENVKYIADYLRKQEYIMHQNIEIKKDIGLADYEPTELNTQMTIEGWEKYDELQRVSKDSRLVFMAMKYNDHVLDKIFNNVIKSAVYKTGFEIRKLDDVKRAGLIDDKLRVEIRRSKFLIADLTHDNNGAYWEAGYAEGLGMHVIFTCEKGKFETEKSHFDTNHHHTVLWKDDEEALNQFAEELKATIRATFWADAKMED